MSDNAGYGLRNIARESLRNLGLLGVARAGLRLTRSHYRLLSFIPVETIPHLPFKWQVLRMRPGKMDVRAVTSALRVWCHFIAKTREIDGGIVELGVRAGDSLIPAALWARNRGILVGPRPLIATQETIKTRGTGTSVRHSRIKLWRIAR